MLTYADAVHAAQSLRVQMSFDCADFKDLFFFLVSSIPSGSYILSAALSADLSECSGEGFEEHITFRTDGSKVSHSLHII